MFDLGADGESDIRRATSKESAISNVSLAVDVVQSPGGL